MSIVTAELEAAARALEQTARQHKANCTICGRVKPRKGQCATGKRLADQAAAARQEARDSAQADKSPGPGDIALFGLSELDNPQVIPARSGRGRVTPGHRPTK